MISAETPQRIRCKFLFNFFYLWRWRSSEAEGGVALHCGGGQRGGAGVIAGEVSKVLKLIHQKNDFINRSWILTVPWVPAQW